MSGSSSIQDLQYAINRLGKRRGFSAVAIATLALAIGANTAMFSFVNGMLLSPLPYPDADRIVRVLERHPNGGVNAISTLNYLDWANQNTVFQYMAAEAGWRATLTGGEEAFAIRGAQVSPQYFDIFGVKAQVGRTFVAGEDQPGKDRVVLLSHVLWQDRFDSDRALIGGNILLDGQPYTVIGILPEDSPFDRAAAQIWKPLAFAPSNMTRDFRWLGATAKLKPNVTLANARAEMDVIAQRLASAYPNANKGWSVAVDRLADVLIGPQLGSALVVLFAATLFVLLIGCANMANLTLARGIGRQSEMAVRAALGASRWRLVRQVLIENLVIAVCGGAAGVGVGYAMLKWIQSLIPAHALPPAVDIRMDVPVLVFAMTTAVVTGLLFGIAPAAQITNWSPATAIRKSEHGRTTGSTGRRMRSVLVAAEMALAFVLLVVSGLLMRSFFKLLEVDPGFNAANVLTAGLPIRQERHPDPGELNAYLAAITAAVKGIPGVREIAMTSALPLEGWGFGVPYSIAGREGHGSADRRSAFLKIVSPSYFGALGIKLLAGRVLSDHDRAGAPPVAVINESFAKREFAGQDPIGRRINAPELVPGTTQLGREIAWEIVGVIAGEKITGLGDEVSAGMYVSNEQSPTYDINLIVRAVMPPQSVQRAVRSAIDSVNNDQALSDVRTLQQIIDRSTSANRFMSTLLMTFAGIALVLAVVGIYGVVSYTAAQRTHEMGLRAALGATAGSLMRLTFRAGMGPALTGLAIGLTTTTAVTRMTSSLLYGIASDDALTFAVVAGVLCAIAALACFVPAWRVGKINPIEALRDE